MKFLSDIHEGQWAGKQVLLRADFNVPTKNGNIADDTRIRKTIPTITAILKTGVSLVICSHLGRPKGSPDKKYSLSPVAKMLSELLSMEVKFFKNTLSSPRLSSGEVGLLENTRFFPEETKNGVLFSALLSQNVDIFVNDAFGTAHRNHASTTGVMKFLPAYAGLLLQKEKEVLDTALQGGDHPVTFLAGGAKMETKIGVLQTFVKKADFLLLGGGIANTFLAAKGIFIGDSLYEASEINTAKQILRDAEENECQILLPEDVVTATEVSPSAPVSQESVYEISEEEKILDLGKDSAQKYAEIIEKSEIFVWNGPVGIFEIPSLSAGTRAIADAAARMSGRAILGGGDTLSAIAKYGYGGDDFYHISTGGGAMLSYLEGSDLPVFRGLEEN